MAARREVIPTPPMAEAARWLEWQGRGAVARTAAVALGAGAAAATAGAFIHAAFTPGANRWLRVPDVTTTRFLSCAQQTHTTAPAQPLGPVTTVACRLIALTAQLRPQPLPLEELHAPDDGMCDADALVEAALATPGLRMRVLRLLIHALSPQVALHALAAWGPAGLIEWDAEVRFPFHFNITSDPAMKAVARAFGECTTLRVLRCDNLYITHLAPLPSVRVATVIRHANAPVRLATIATLFPHLEHLRTGPGPSNDVEEWAALFAVAPSLTRISWCHPRFGSWAQQREPSTGPQLVPAPQARLVPPAITPAATYAALYPGVEELRDYFEDAATPMICALKHLRVLSITAQGYFQSVISSHRMVFKKHPSSVPHDADVAQMLASLPLLEVLDLSVYNGRNPHLTFATADYDGVVAPRLRTLKAAGALQLRGAGLRALARMCPNLRHLDVRAAFAMSREEFISGMLELSVAAGGAAARTLETQQRNPVRRLRLPKLRRLYSSFRRRLPKALNFNTYCSGWSVVHHDEFERPMDIRDAELEPPLEPEQVVVYFSPRRNKRRLLLLPNDGIDVHVRIEDPVPGEFAPRHERERHTVGD